jgi:hypothetical protein
MTRESHAPTRSAGHRGRWPVKPPAERLPIHAGVDLTGDADSLFAHHQPWTTAAGQQPDRRDGHCVLKVAADGADFDTWITWGGAQRSTLAWTAACLQETWVIITQEDGGAANLDIATLRAEIDALHGTGGSSPASKTSGL